MSHKLFLWSFRVLLIVISSAELWQYYAIKILIEQSDPIPYSVDKNIVKVGGRGNSYDMTIRYNGREYKEIPITRKLHDQIEHGRLPTLYYSTKNNKVYSAWSRDVSMRISLVFLFLFIVSFTPAKVFKEKSRLVPK